MTDPIQHLRELMAKATPGRLQAMPDSPFGALTESGEWFCEMGPSDQDEDNAAFIVALRNLAPQLLEVVESARAVAEWDDEVHSGNGVRYARLIIALREKLAALGGKGGGKDGNDTTTILDGRKYQ